MKKNFKLLGAVLCILALPGYGQNRETDYLSHVLEKMNAVESVTYHCVIKSWEPGDKEPVYNVPIEIYEHVNPQDTAVGYSFLCASDKEFRRPLWVYDGTVFAYIEKEEKEVRIDDFTQKSPLPFRVIMPQAFGCMKSILEYALNTQDSIVLSLKDEGKDYLMELSIHTPYQVEFFGKACYMPQNPYTYDPTSIYKIWISKEDDMPYRYRREMQHSISEGICSDFVYNPAGKGKIVAEDYYPADYVRRIKGEKSQKATVDMTGKKAPDWTLTDMKGQKVSLSGIKSKVILLQFTGIGCGPCKISIPFLNRLKKEYAVNELEVLAVETWGRSKSSCEAYVKNQGIEYSFLTADKETIAKLINDYQASNGVPQFYLIGKDRTIIAKFQGYAEKTTDTEIEKKIKANL